VATVAISVAAETRMSRKMAYQKQNRVSAEVSESSSHDSGRAQSSINAFVCAAEFGPPEELFAPVDSGDAPFDSGASWEELSEAQIGLGVAEYGAFCKEFAGTIKAATRCGPAAPPRVCAGVP